MNERRSKKRKDNAKMAKNDKQQVKRWIKIEFRELVFDPNIRFSRLKC